MAVEAFVIWENFSRFGLTAQRKFDYCCPEYKNEFRNTELGIQWAHSPDVAEIG
jgi:hypothetical protein